MASKKKPPQTLEERVARLEEAIAVLVFEIEDLHQRRLVTMGTLGGFMGLLNAKGLVQEGDEDRVLAIAEEIATLMEKARAKGLEEDRFLRSTISRRRQKHPRDK